MHLRFESRLDFAALARALCVDLTEDSIDYDYENVYEWMYVDLPQIEFSLNVSREHGWADIEDEMLDKYEHHKPQLRELVQPGLVYVFGWSRETDDYVDDLPDFLPSLVADRLGVDVSVFSRRINVDSSDGEPIAVVRPAKAVDPQNDRRQPASK